MNTATIRSLLRFSIFSLMIASAFALVAIPAHAQFNASLSGTITDSTGGGIPDATVTLVDEGTRQTVVRKSSGTGVFEFPSLGEGKYDLTVTAKGFKPGWFGAACQYGSTPELGRCG